MQTGAVPTCISCGRLDRPKINFKRHGVRVRGSDLCVPMSSMCKKQSQVSHSNAKRQYFFLDAGLRMERSPAQQLWHTVLDVLSGQFKQPSNDYRPKPSKKYLQLKLFDGVHQNVPIRHHSALLQVALIPRLRPSSSSSQENEEEEDGEPTHKLIPSSLRAG